MDRCELYRLLGEPVRLRLLALCAEEVLAVGELAELLTESQPNVSRHVSALRAAGIINVKKQGTRVLVSAPASAFRDPVVADARNEGQRICNADGSFKRIASVIAAREASVRDFFASAPESKSESFSAMAPYLAALRPLLAHCRFAVDAGTGDGALLEIIAPIFERVVAFDREAVQLSRAKARVSARRWTNVSVMLGVPDSPSIIEAVSKGGGADVVFASRLLHHSSKPAQLFEQLEALLCPGGTLLVIDYEAHDDDSMREHHADLWLGFSSKELRGFAKKAGLEAQMISPLPSPGDAVLPDAHLPWQLLVAKKQGTHRAQSRDPRKTKGDHHV